MRTSRPIKTESGKVLMGAWYIVFWLFIVFAVVWCGSLLKTNMPTVWIYIAKPFDAFYNVAHIVGVALSEIGTTQELHKKINQQRVYVDELETKLALVQQENSFLKSQIGLRTPVAIIPYVAHISVKDPFGFANFVTADLGFHQGVKEFMNVVGEGRALVGRVGAVRENSSQIILLSDPLSRVSAQTQNAHGVVVGQLRSELIFDLIPKQSTLAEGDIVYTSGLDGIFIPGLPIGRIKNIINNQSDIYQRAIIEPSLEYSQLSEVLIIQGFQ